MRLNLVKKMLVAFALLVIVVGCSAQGQTEAENNSGSNSNDGGDTKKSYFINPKSVGSAYWSAVEKGVVQAGEDLDVDVVFNGPSTTDSSQQINMIQDMLTRQVDGIGVSPNDPEAVGPVFETAASQGAKVVTFDSDAENTNREYFVTGTTDEIYGTEFAKMMAEEIDGKGKVAFMVADLAASNQKLKFEAAEKYLNENYPDIEIVATVSSDDEQQKAFVNAQNLISAHPDLDGIIGFAGAEPPAAAQAIEQAISEGTIEEGQIKISGFAVPSQVEKYVLNGTIERMVTWDPIKLGYATVYVLDHLANGEEVTDGMEIPTIGEIQVEGNNILIGYEVVDKDNVSDFEF